MARTSDYLLFEETGESRLHRRAHRVDFIQEQRTHGGVVQGGREHRIIEARAIDPHELAAPMNEPGDSFSLANAWASDQDGTVRVSREFDEAVHLTGCRGR